LSTCSSSADGAAASFLSLDDDSNNTDRFLLAGDADDVLAAAAGTAFDADRATAFFGSIAFGVTEADADVAVIIFGPAELASERAGVMAGLAVVVVEDADLAWVVSGSTPPNHTPACIASRLFCSNWALTSSSEPCQCVRSYFCKF